MNQQITNLRAFAIMLIVLGHSIIIYDTNFALLSTDVKMPLFQTLKHLVSFIQLKLFFSISGFLMCYKVIKWQERTVNEIFKGSASFIWNKFKRLMIPMLCVCFLYMDPIKLLIGVPDYALSWDFAAQQLTCTNIGHLWFLPCLFIIFIVMFFLLALVRNSKIGHIALFLVLALLTYKSGIFPKVFQLNEVAYYMSFFYLGYLINRVKIAFPEYKLRFKYIFAAMLIIVIGGGVLCKITSIGYEFYLSIVVVVLCYAIMPASRNRVIDTISNNSYGIYLFHSPLIYITAIYTPNINPWLMLFINFLAFGFVAYVITYLLDNSRLRFIVGKY